MGNVRVVSSRLPQWRVQLEAVLGELHRRLLACAVDPQLDSGAGLTIAAVDVRELLDWVWSTSDRSESVEQPAAWRPHGDGGAAGLVSLARFTLGLVARTLHGEPDLGLDDLRLLTAVARTVRGIDELLTSA